MQTVYFVPFSEEGLGDRFFELYKNRTQNLPTLGYLREYLGERGIEARTIDSWDGRRSSADTIISFDYPPTGMYRLAYFLRGLLGKKGGFPLDEGQLQDMLTVFREKILLQWESPVNYPWMYKHAGGLHQFYDKIYSIPHFPGSERFYYPQSFDSWSREYFDRPRTSFMVFMNTPRRAKGFFEKELYTKREAAAEFFAKHGELDIYGDGWERHASGVIRGAAKGFVDNKAETFSRYRFALCFENAVWPGYVTEKIFDCMRVGTIPVYWGAPDVEHDVPASCFIDASKFKDYDELRAFLHARAPEDIRQYREAMRSYFGSAQFRRFTPAHFAQTIHAMITG